MATSRTTTRRRFLRHLGLGLAASLGLACRAGDRSTAAVGAKPPSTDLHVTWSGKTVTLSVGSQPGSTFDTWARMVGRHLGRHLPGTPDVVVENVVGGDHRVATNRLYAAKPDGLSIGLVDRAVPGFQLSGEGPESGVRYDVTKMSWLGSTTSERQVLVVHSRAGVRSVKQLETTPLRMGHQSLGNSPHMFDAVLREGLGWAREKRVFGWEGTADLILAIERGDVDAMISAWATVGRRKQRELEAGEWVALAQMGAGEARDPSLAAIPTADELLADKSPEVRAMLDMVQRPFVYARPLVAPPGLEPAILAALRTAFLATMDDPAFRSEVAQQSLDLDPLPGERVQELIAAQLQTPRAVVERLNALIQADAPG